jgi:hypothetical protein
MKHKNLAELTDQELLDESKKIKSNAIMNAVLIGFWNNSGRSQVKCCYGHTVCHCHRHRFTSYTIPYKRVI